MLGGHCVGLLAMNGMTQGVEMWCGYDNNGFYLNTKGVLKAQLNNPLYFLESSVAHVGPR